MIAFAAATILVLLALLAAALEKAYFYLPSRELKRQAARRDHVASVLYQAAAYGAELRLLLFVGIAIGAAAGFVVLAGAVPPLISFIIISLVFMAAYAWLPRTRLSPAGAWLAMACTPAIVHALHVLHPVAQRAVHILRRYHAYEHTGVYERADVLDLIERQEHQSDNRMSERDLELMRNALQFGDFRVLDVVVPARRVKSVSADDDISPVLLAELHTTGHPRFPVYEGKQANVVGTLAIDQVADLRHHGKVRDSFDSHVAYVHEQDTLPQALRAFYETRQHLFIVVNKMDEYVGIITLSDILQKLSGAVEHEAFGHHHDRAAVVHRHDTKEKAEQPEEKISKDTPEVVE